MVIFPISLNDKGYQVGFSEPRVHASYFIQNHFSKIMLFVIATMNELRYLSRAIMSMNDWFATLFVLPIPSSLGELRNVIS